MMLLLRYCSTFALVVTAVSAAPAAPSISDSSTTIENLREVIKNDPDLMLKATWFTFGSLGGAVGIKFLEGVVTGINKPLAIDHDNMPQFPPQCDLFSDVNYQTLYNRYPLTRTQPNAYETEQAFKEGLKAGMKYKNEAHVDSYMLGYRRALKEGRNLQDLPSQLSLSNLLDMIQRYMELAASLHANRLTRAAFVNGFVKGLLDGWRASSSPLELAATLANVHQRGIELGPCYNRHRDEWIQCGGDGVESHQQRAAWLSLCMQEKMTVIQKERKQRQRTAETGTQEKGITEQSNQPKGNDVLEPSTGLEQSNAFRPFASRRGGRATAVGESSPAWAAPVAVSGGLLAGAAELAAKAGGAWSAVNRGGTGLSPLPGE